MRDLKSNILAVTAIAPEVLTGQRTGSAIDLLDSNRMAMIVSTGAIVGAGDFSVKLQESDTTAGGDFADVAAEWVDSEAPATLEADTSYRIGYMGHKRYVRPVVTRAGGTSLALAATAILSDLSETPV